MAQLSPEKRDQTSRKTKCQNASTLGSHKISNEMLHSLEFGISSANRNAWTDGGGMVMATIAATAVGCAAVAIRAAQPLRC
jgi:hypothetical protein